LKLRPVRLALALPMGSLRVNPELPNGLRL